MVAVLGAVLCSACEPRDTYEVANGTQQVLVVDDRELEPGDSADVELGTRCEDVVVRTVDRRREAVLHACAHDEIAVRPADLRASAVLTVENATDETFDIWFAGTARVEAESLEPGQELTVPLEPDEGSCETDPQGRALLWAVETGGAEGALTAYRWGELCDGDRWVISAAAVAEASAALTVVNETDIAMRVSVWVGDRGSATTDADGGARLTPGESHVVALRVPADQCLDGGVMGTATLDGEVVSVDTELLLCDDTVAITPDLLRHQVGGRWVPLDYPPEGRGGGATGARGR